MKSTQNPQSPDSLWRGARHVPDNYLLHCPRFSSHNDCLSAACQFGETEII